MVWRGTNDLVTGRRLREYIVVVKTDIPPVVADGHEFVHVEVRREWAVAPFHLDESVARGIVVCGVIL